MFKKISLVLMLLVITACGNRLASCKLEKEDKYISLDIKAHNDDITSIRVRTCFVLPDSLMADKDWLAALNKQLDDNYHYEDNNLVNEYDIALDDTYSLNKTIEYLRKEKFYCE